VHTNSFESLWRQVKAWLEHMRGMDRDKLQTYLEEFCEGKILNKNKKLKIVPKHK
jgi:uncharacterized protein (DUF1786 family)